jgi:pimeloyl-ACP methyl ester carboxylesterase
MLPPLPELRFARIPHHAASRYAGDRFTYLEAGLPDAPPVLMLHGIGSHAAYFRFQLTELSKRFRVIAWNAPGYFLSDALINPSPTGQDYAQAVADFSEAVGLLQFTLCGNSFGSAVAQAFAIHFPHQVTNLLLTGAGVGQKELNAERAATFHQRLARIRRGTYQYGDAGVDNLLAKGAPKETRQLMTDMARALSPAGIESAVAFRLSDFYSPDHAEKLTMPVLLIQGSEDRVNPRESNADLLLPRLPNATLQEWTGVGHLPEVEAPERFNTTLTMFIERGNAL